MPFRLRAEGLEFLERAPRILAFSRVVPAPREQVFATVVADPSTWRTWFPGLHAGGYVGPPPYAVGSGRYVKVRGMGTYRETVMAWDEPSRWVYRVDSTSMPMLRALMEEWTFEEATDGTLVRWTFACDPRAWFGVLLRVAPGQLERVFDQAMRNLSSQLAGSR